LLIPKYASWLNLIEPWWKQLRSLALKGRRFETVDELTLALNHVLAYWNTHRHPYSWKKKPQQQVTLFGGYSVCKGSVTSST
jgi:transposase